MRAGGLLLLVLLAACSGVVAELGPVVDASVDASDRVELDASVPLDAADDRADSEADAPGDAVADVADASADARDAGDACVKRVCIPKGHCDLMDDGCGGKIDCGKCDPPNTCGVLNPNECSCIPKRCQDVPNSCGAMPDGCNGTNNCPACPALKGCGEGTTPFVCGTFYERCSTTNFPGSQCVVVNGQPNNYRYCTQALLNLHGNAHNCIPWSPNVCSDANGQWRCDF
jgi:hypothetical protein